MKINIPDYFNQNIKHKSIIIDDFAVIDYKIYNNNEKVYSVSNTNLLIFVLTGRKHIQFSEADFYISEGQAVFIKSGNFIMSQIIAQETRKYESLIFCLNNEMLKDFYFRYNKDTFVKDNEQFSKYIKLNLSKSLINEIETLLDFFIEDNVYMSDIVKLKIYVILLKIENQSNFLFDYIRNNIIDSSPEFQKYMESNYDKPVTLDKLANEFGMSISTFKRHFKAEFNCSPKNWINNKRLEKAAYLLKSSTFSITDICFIIGFDNVSHFILLFKNKFDCTPKQYKNNYNNGLINV